MHPPNSQSASIFDCWSGYPRKFSDQEVLLSAVRDDAREAIGKILDERIDEELLNKLFENVLGIEKQSRGWCPSCKKSVYVSIPDAKAVVSALNELLVQAKGRPGQAEQGEDRSVTFTNKVVLVSDV